MSLIETLSDVNNTFLARREIVCIFRGLGGKLKKTEASDMIAKQFKLDGKVVIPILMKNQSGKQDVTGTFYVYDSEELAKKQVNSVIFTRLEKARAKEAPPAEEKKEEPEEVKEAAA